jgi:hypothetical protein
VRTFFFFKNLDYICDVQQKNSSDMNKNFTLTNGKTIAQVEQEMKLGIEKLYLDAWAKGVSVPYWDEDRVLHLANPDGSDDLAEFDANTKKITVISRLAEPGQGRFAYLLAS